MAGMSDLALSILMAGALALAGGGIWMFVKGGDRKRGALMLVAAVVMLINVLLWA